MFMALMSLATGRTVRSDTSMTGEISLRGLVLPVGGIKEKVVAAAAAGLTRVMLPARNRSDYEDIPEEVRQPLTLFGWNGSTMRSSGARDGEGQGARRVIVRPLRTREKVARDVRSASWPSSVLQQHFYRRAPMISARYDPVLVPRHRFGRRGYVTTYYIVYILSLERLRRRSATRGSPGRLCRSNVRWPRRRPGQRCHGCGRS